MATKKMGKYERDLSIVNEVFNRNVFDTSDRAILVSIIQANFHESGKIQGIQSIDSSCSGCSFCENMRKSKNPKFICTYCYDAKLENLRTSMRNRHQLNLRILSSILFTEEELAMIPIYTQYLRFNSSGDLENETHARNYFRIAKSHKNTIFALWAKNLVAVRKAIEKEGKPENLIIIYSDPIINGGVNKEVLFKAFPWIDNIFMVAEENKIDSFLESGCNECNGKICNKCGYKCYNHSWKKHTVIVEKKR